MSDILRRSWWPIAAGVCIAALVALVELGFTPQVFVARSDVAVDPNKLPPGALRWDGEIDFEKLSHALRSDATLHHVIVRAFPSPSSPEAERALADDIRSRLALSYSRRTGVIEFRYRDSEPVRAAKVVNVFARFLGEESIVFLALPPEAPVSPKWILVDGVAAGVVGGLLVFLGSLLGRVAVAGEFLHRFTAFKTQRFR